MTNNAVERLLIAADKLRNDANLISQKLIDSCTQIDWAYNPLDYAWEPHQEYIKRYGGLGAKTVMLGMNPGHGMGNTGIPFGCPEQVKKYLKIKNLEVKQPNSLHPKRPVYGLDCPKPEVSGRRIWGLLSELYGTPEDALSNVYIINHFPLWMFNDSGQNITPNKLPSSNAKELFECCDSHLLDVVDALGANRIIGVGAYAESMARKALDKAERTHILLEKIPHPSPANPLANKEKGAIWREMVTSVLKN